jgi:hypothetical protein
MDNDYWNDEELAMPENAKILNLAELKNVLEKFIGKSVCVDIHGSISWLFYAGKFDCWIEQDKILVLYDVLSENFIHIEIDEIDFNDLENDSLTGLNINLINGLSLNIYID